MTTATLAIRDTTVGKKIVMAASGVVLFGFSIVHMLGNLQIFAGPETINGYHVLLYGMPGLLWGARAVLLIALAAHVISAVQLARLNSRARPERYARTTRVATTYAARTMLIGGLLLFVYLVHHIAHMTVGATAGLGYQHDHVDVFSNLVHSYSVPWMAGLSVVATLIFGSHVYHGAWSLFQTLGINHRRYNDALRSTAVAIACAVTLGYIAVPIAVVFGLVP